MKNLNFRAWDEKNKIMHHNVGFIKSGQGAADWVVFTSNIQPDLERAVANPFFDQQIKITQATPFSIIEGQQSTPIYSGDILLIISKFGAVTNKKVIVGMYQGAWTCLDFFGLDINSKTYDHDKFEEYCEYASTSTLYDVINSNKLQFSSVSCSGNIYANSEYLGVEKSDSDGGNMESPE